MARRYRRRMPLDDRTLFRERLSLPWWWWPICLAVAIGLAIELGMGVPGIVTWLPLALLVPLTVAGLLWLGRIRISIDDTDFRIDDACLPREFIASVEPLSGTPLRDALTAQLHPLAFVIKRPWVRSAVRITVNDPQDPTPYWIVSTKRPEEIRTVLEKTRCDTST